MHAFFHVYFLLKFIIYFVAAHGKGCEAPWDVGAHRDLLGPLLLLEVTTVFQFLYLRWWQLAAAMRMETLGVTNRDLSSLSTPEITSPVSIPTRCETSPVVICSSFFALFFFLCSYPERMELGVGYMAFGKRQIKKFYR